MASIKSFPRKYQGGVLNDALDVQITPCRYAYLLTLPPAIKSAKSTMPCTKKKERVDGFGPGIAIELCGGEYGEESVST